MIMIKSANQKLADRIIGHQLFFSRFSTGEANKILALLRKGDVRITMMLTEALRESEANALNWNQARLSAIKRGIKDSVFSVYEQAFGQLRADFTAIAGNEAAFYSGAIAASIPSAAASLYPVVSVTAEQVAAAALSKPFQGQLLSQWAKSVPTKVVDAIGSTVQQGILLGQSHTEIIANVRGTSANNYQNGLLARQRNGLAAVVKTATNHIAAEARTLTAQRNSDIIKGRQWLSTLDSHTTTMCIIRDGKQYTNDDKPQPIGHKIPYGAGPSRIHFCCRSVETLITKSWKEMGIDAGEMDVGTRASMNGQVAADMTYSQWIERQPYAVIEKVFGVTRAQMIRDGKVKPDTLFNDKGEFLSLSQLRDIDILLSS
uniref:Head morphogenesis protein n=1 Tax=Pectobacterium phage Amona TaxID=3158137 RepID=A0AB39ABB5_9CAUD